MTNSEASEIRTALARCRADERETQSMQLAYESGHMARLVGEPESACPYRRPERCNAWLRGWLEAERVLSEAEAVRSLSPVERAKGLEALAELRAKLPFLGADGDEQTG
jgi:ribosome modulation factor